MSLNVRETLKRETAKQHQQIETNMALMHPDVSLESYKNILSKFYSFYKKFENSFAEIASSIPELDLESRQKTRLLEDDLSSLRVTSDERKPPKIPDVTTKAAFLGAFYVLEGSTLGGQMLFKHFSQHLPITPESGGSFYYCYGPKTGQMWQKFIQILEREVTTEDELAQAVKSANSTFECLGQWMSSASREPPSQDQE